MPCERGQCVELSYFAGAQKQQSVVTDLDIFSDEDGYSLDLPFGAPDARYGLFWHR